VEKKNVYYEITQNKVDFNRRLSNLTSPLNPKKPIFDATIDEHIHPQHWLSDPFQAKADRWKYMAYFDLILDNHMRQVRPNGVYDDIYTYVKPQHRPLYVAEEDFMNNMYFEYRFSHQNEYFQAWIRDNNLYFEGKFDQIGADPVQPQVTHAHEHHAATTSDHHDELHGEKHGHNEVDPTEDPVSINNKIESSLRPAMER
jgi:hypothetical protein